MNEDIGKAWDDLENGTFPLSERGRFAKANPENADAWAFFARADLDGGCYEDAVTHADHSVALDPLNGNAWLAKLEAHVELNHFEKVREIAANFEKVSPTSSDVFQAKGLVSFFEGDYSGAVDHLVQARALDPGDSGILVFLFHASLSGAPSQTLAVLEELRRIASNRLTTLLCESHWALKQGNPAKALQFVRQASEIGPESPQAWALLAIVAMIRADYGTAESAARRAIAINPRRSDAWTVLAKVAAQKGNRQAASEYRKRAESESPYLLYKKESRQASLLLARGRHAQAVQLVETILADPRGRYLARPMHYVRFQALLGLEEWKKLDAALDEYEREFGRDATWYASRANMAIRKGPATLALELATKGLEEFPTNGALMAVKLVALRELSPELLPAYVDELCRIPFHTPDHGLLAVGGLREVGFRKEARRLMDSVKRQFPDHQTVEFVHATHQLTSSPLRSLLRILKVNAPELKKARGQWLLTCGVVVVLLSYYAYLIANRFTHR